MASLPISPYLEEIEDTVAHHVISVVVAFTGSGKSILVPQRFAAGGTRILVSVPTIMAAKGLSTYQKKISPYLQVGYAYEGQKNYDKQTQIIYATSGHVRRMMFKFFRDGRPSDFNWAEVLMVDEYHSGSLDNSVIVALWKYMLNQGAVVPRILLTSATLGLQEQNSGVLAAFEEIAEPAVFDKVAFGTFEVKTHYTKKDYRLTDETLYSDAVEKALVILEKRPQGGNVLIFAPGENEVLSMVDLLNRRLQDKRQRNILVLPAYSGLESEERDKIEAPSEFRKVIVATNIAESAITLEGLEFIIDTLTERRADTSNSGGIRLVLSNVSRSSAQQRSGRVGRTAPGTVVRMMTQDSYDKLPYQRAPEIERIPLFNVMMETINAGLKPEELFTEIEESRLEEAYQVLTELELIQTQKNKRIVTEAGAFVTLFPMSVKNAAVIWRWKEAGRALYPILAIMSMIDSYGSPSIFYVPRKGPVPAGEGTDYKQREKIHEEEYRQIVKERYETYFKKFIGYSDIDTLLNVTIDLLRTVESPSAPAYVVKEWCNENSMNYKKIRETLQIMNRSIAICLKQGLEVKIAAFTTKEIMKHLRPLLAEVYASTRMELTPGNRIMFRLGKDDYMTDNRLVLNEFARDPPEEIVSLLSTENVSGKTTRTTVLSLDVPAMGARKAARAATPPRKTNQKKTDAEPAPKVKPGAGVLSLLGKY